MEGESTKVRLARIEEGMAAIHGKMDSNHRELKIMLRVPCELVPKHHDWLIALRRDRWWLVTVAVTLIGVVAERIHAHFS